MFDYIKGTIKSIYKDSIVIENENIGYKIMTSNPYSFKIDQEVVIYTYLYVKEDLLCLYGFQSNNERELFLKLISVSGIGPKSAISILASGNVSNINNAINNGDVKYLCKFPGIGSKSAQQIILDLKGKLTFNVEQNGNYLILDEVHEALSALGYSEKDINKVLPKLDSTKDINQLIKDALGFIFKN